MAEKRLTDDEVREITAYTKALRHACDITGDGLPCRSCRLAALPIMARYLRIHGYTVEEPH